MSNELQKSQDHIQSLLPFLDPTQLKLMVCMEQIHTSAMHGFYKTRYPCVDADVILAPYGFEFKNDHIMWNNAFLTSGSFAQMYKSIADNKVYVQLAKVGQQIIQSAKKNSNKIKLKDEPLLDRVREILVQHGYVIDVDSNIVLFERPWPRSVGVNVMAVSDVEDVITKDDDQTNKSEITDKNDPNSSVSHDEKPVSLFIYVPPLFDQDILGITFQTIHGEQSEIIQIHSSNNKPWLKDIKCGDIIVALNGVVIKGHDHVHNEIRTNKHFGMVLELHRKKKKKRWSWNKKHE